MYSSRKKHRRSKFLAGRLNNIAFIGRDSWTERSGNSDFQRGILRFSSSFIESRFIGMAELVSNRAKRRRGIIPMLSDRTHFFAAHDFTGLAIYAADIGTSRLHSPADPDSGSVIFSTRSDISFFFFFPFFIYLCCYGLLVSFNFNFSAFSFLFATDCLRANSKRGILLFQRSDQFF